MRASFLIFLLFSSQLARAQQLRSFTMNNDVRVTIDAPEQNRGKESLIIFYALPNGNTTEQTMGKLIEEGDDWHFDIQHIGAQTSFLRKTLAKENVYVVYLENKLKSWPSWKQNHKDFGSLIPHIVDSISNIICRGKKKICLNGHSGGGSFIFGYLDGVDPIPSNIERISFLDSNYGYDSSYYHKITHWLQQNKKAVMTVFAYNDSVALYNGKPVVSEKGGTWYKSRLMLSHFQNDFKITETRSDSLIFYESRERNIGIFLKNNPERRIFHTQQVEYNGFVHSILFGTKGENKNYRYYEGRAYADLIRPRLSVNR